MWIYVTRAKLRLGGLRVEMNDVKSKTVPFSSAFDFDQIKKKNNIKKRFSSVRNFFFKPGLHKHNLNSC